MTPVTADENIIKLLRQRDISGLALLYDKYAPTLWGMILLNIKDISLAEMILKDTFNKVWNNFASFNDKKRSLFTWLSDMTINIISDCIQSKGISLSELVDSGAISPENRLSRALPLADKKLLHILYFQGRAVTDAAKMLNLSSDTVKKRLRGTILILKAMF